MGERIDKASPCWVAVLALLVLQPETAAALDSPGCLAGGAPATVTAVDEVLDLHLADGRVVHLPGIAVPDATAEARRDLAVWLSHTVVSVAPLRTEPDRWNRVVALAFAPPPGASGQPVSVTEALLDAGRVLARPDPLLEACWATALRLERGAEEGKRGLWKAVPALRPDDAGGLRAQAGRFALIEGRIAAVREGRARTYLRFAEDRGTGMAATLAPVLVRRLVKAGTAPRDWAGRRLRVRGLLDDRWGWQIEVTAPQQLEFDRP